MFKSASWRSEKKIKAVFMMQFQATEVPQLKAKKLMISLIPADVGKPTVRLGKAAIVEGTCAWEYPIYETVKLVKETKTGKLKPKIYHFVVSTGSSKSGYLGEASVDFSYLLEATKPAMLSLPLQASNSGAILHVTIQKLDGTLDQRCFEEDGSATPMSYGSLEIDLEDTDKFEKKNLAFTEEEDDYITPHHHKHIGRFEVPQSVSTTARQDFIDTAEDMHPKVSYDSNQKLLNQIKMLERQAEVSELELQSLRKQILKESRKVEELSREIVNLKKEGDVLKAKCEGQKPSPQRIGEPEVSNNSHQVTVKLNPIPEDIRQELQREKHLNRKLRFQLQKTEDSNSELILAVRDLKEMLNKKKKEISHISRKLKANQDDPEALSEALKPKMDQDGETKVLENLFNEQSREDETEDLKQKIQNLNNEIEHSRKEKEDINKCLQLLSTDYEILEKEKADIYFDLHKMQVSMMEMQHEYTASLATVKHLRLQQEKLEEEIKKQTLLSSKYLVEINDLETQVRSLEEELEKQAQDFEHDLKEVTQAKVEQEQRARQADETIEKVKKSNSKQVEHLKAEFTRTTEEMAFKIDANEKLASKAVAEANELLLQNENLEKLLQETKDELELIKDVYSTNEAQPTDSQMMKGQRRQEVDKSVCNEEEKQKGKYEKKRKDHQNEQRHCSLEVNVENNTLKSQVIELKKHDLHNNKQETRQVDDAIMHDRRREEGKSRGENGCFTAQRKSNATHAGQGMKMDGGQANKISDLTKLLNEVRMLKEQNEQKDVDLKEMQERYSEISLRFAEVEGERQQLVMALRNLKNGKKK